MKLNQKTEQVSRTIWYMPLFKEAFKNLNTYQQYHNWTKQEQSPRETQPRMRVEILSHHNIQQVLGHRRQYQYL